MDQNTSTFGGTSVPPELSPTGIAEASKKHVEDVINLQTELFKYLQDVNRSWFDHMQSEAALASEFANKLAAARTIPQTASAYQEWANRRIELLAQDGRNLLADTEKFMETGARVFSNGWPGAKS